MRRLSLLPTLLLSLALTLSLAACDSNDDDGDNNGNGGGPGGGGEVGNVSVTVSGDVTDSFSGNAFFTLSNDSDAPGFAIGLFSGAINNPNTGQIVVLGRDGGRPGPGTYTIDTEDGDDSDFGGGYTNYQGNDGDVTNSLTIVAETGTLQITSSSTSSVAGSFTFTGTVFDFENPTDTTRTATVQGEFEAAFIDPGEGPDLPTGGF